MTVLQPSTCEIIRSQRGRNEAARPSKSRLVRTIIPPSPAHFFVPLQTFTKERLLERKPRKLVIVRKHVARARSSRMFSVLDRGETFSSLASLESRSLQIEMTPSLCVVKNLRFCFLLVLSFRHFCLSCGATAVLS